MIFYVIKQMKEGKSIEEIKKSKGGEQPLLRLIDQKGSNALQREGT